MEPTDGTVVFNFQETELKLEEELIFKILLIHLKINNLISVIKPIYIYLKILFYDFHGGN